MPKLADLLRGKKTYLVAIALGVLAALHIAGVIDETLYGEIAGLLGAAGLATLRMGVAASK